jgi:hypothetical protein
MSTRYPATQAASWEKSDRLWSRTRGNALVDEFTKASICNNDNSNAVDDGSNNGSATQDYQSKEFRGRTRALVLRAKMKHRSDLKNGEKDWTKYKHNDKWNETKRELSANCIENIPREHVDFLSLESFRARYEYVCKVSCNFMTNNQKISMWCADAEF